MSKLQIYILDNCQKNDENAKKFFLLLGAYNMFTQSSFRHSTSTLTQILVKSCVVIVLDSSCFSGEILHDSRCSIKKSCHKNTEPTSSLPRGGATAFLSVLVAKLFQRVLLGTTLRLFLADQTSKFFYRRLWRPHN